MRAIQFWVSLIGSIIISGILIKQIYLNKEIVSQQRAMVDDQEIAAQSEQYREMWKDLVVTVYTNSRQDPPLAAVLRDENVGISTLPPGATPSSSVPAPGAATNPMSSKTPAPAPGPATSTHP